MLDFHTGVLATDDIGIKQANGGAKSKQIRQTKQLMDLLGIVLLSPLLLVATCVLILVNPMLNKGPLFYRQRRMGQNCKPFLAIKFRTMRPATSVRRGAFDALERDRITPFGCLLRKYRIDELPQIVNILRGEMSLVGPRPDFYDHALVYIEQIPGYRARHQVKPGISGLAQTQIGYVDGLRGVERKVACDLTYIARQSLRFDLWIAWRTIVVVATRQGA